MSADAPALIVFARAPVPGRVKTRLIPALGADGAAAVYTRLLERTVCEAEATRCATCYLFADDPTASSYFRLWLSPPRWHIEVQNSGDLGERMLDAFVRVLTRHAAALLIGSDIVDFTAGDLEQAASLLTDHDAVLGPAADGGYWLIGLKRAARALFLALDWGTGTVLAETIARAEAAGMRWTRAATRHDLDRVEDLARFADLLHPPGIAATPARREQT